MSNKNTVDDWLKGHCYSYHNRKNNLLMMMRDYNAGVLSKDDYLTIQDYQQQAYEKHIATCVEIQHELICAEYHRAFDPKRYWEQQLEQAKQKFDQCDKSALYQGKTNSFVICGADYQAIYNDRRQLFNLWIDSTPGKEQPDNLFLGWLRFRLLEKLQKGETEPRRSTKGRPPDESAPQQPIADKVAELACNTRFLKPDGTPKPTAIRDFIFNHHPELAGELKERTLFDRVKRAISDMQ